MKIKNNILKYIMIALLILSVTGCSKEKTVNIKTDNKTSTEELSETSIDDDIEKEYYPITIMDDLKNEVVFEQEPMRIVSVTPANTEIIFALEMEEKLIGVTKDCNYPDEALEIEKIGTVDDLDIEKLVELDIDLIITGYVSDEIISKIKDKGIKILVMVPNDFEGVYNKIEIIGKALNVKEKAEKLVSEMRLKQKEIIERVSNSTKKRVFFELWNEPLMCFGSGSFVDKMIIIANGENIAGNLEELYPNMSTKMLIEKNPEVYIAVNNDVNTIGDIKKRDDYEKISAIRNERIYILDGDIISRPGPRIVDALEMIAKVIHPELYFEK